MVFKLLYLESYLGLSKETRYPTAGSEEGKGQKPQPGFSLHRGAHLPKRQGARTPPGFSLRVPPHGPQPGPGPGPLGGGGLERDARCRAQPRDCPGAGGSLASSIRDHHNISPGQPQCTYNREQEVFSPVFPPTGAAQAQGLLQPGESRLRGSCAAAAAAGAEPSVPGSWAPLPSPARPRTAARTPGPRRRIRGALA